MDETKAENNVEAKGGTAEEMNEDTQKEETKPDIDNDIKVTQAKSVVFKTPSFVIPSKNKVQTKKDAAFDFKTPAVPSLAEKPKGAEKKVDSETMNTDSSSDDKEVKVNENKAKHEETDSVDIKSMDAAEQLRQARAAVPYKEPPWSTICKDKFSLEVIKNGSVIDKIDLDAKAFYVIGRLPSCDIPMEHPSMSRYHAVLQYSNGSADSYPQGWYLFDLDSTHGTWINKHKVPQLKHHRIHVDFCLKFGGSTRLFILQGPDEDRKEESELSVKEMVEQREKQRKEAELLRQAEIDEAQRKAELLKKQEEARGCSWGINEEVEEEEEESEENPFAVADNEELYIDDPKKSLNGYFEREGLDPPEYEFSEVGYGKWKCSVELPLDTPSGEPMVAEVLQSGKKREAVVACALEACRILDRNGVLRQSTHESKKRKQRNWEEDDFYDSDEDVYLDRTGTIEKKREFRKNKMGKTDKKTDTYESLLEKHRAVTQEMDDIEGKLAHAKAQAAAMESEEVDALDAYMSAIKSGMMDTRTKMSLKRRMMELRQEEQKVRKLVNIAKPASLPERVAPKQTTTASSLMSTVGKMKGAVIGGKPMRKPIIPIKTVMKVSDPSKAEEFKEEVEEDEEEETETGQAEVDRSERSIVKSELKINEKSETTSKDRVTTTENDEQIDKPKAAEKQTIEDLSKQSQRDKKDSDNNKPVKSRAKGPALPLAAVLEKLQQEESMESMDAEDPSDNKQTLGDVNKTHGGGERRKHRRQPGGGDKRPKQADPDLNDPEYASWIPPQNQAGDGKTHLNAKYGY